MFFCRILFSFFLAFNIHMLYGHQDPKNRIDSNSGIGAIEKLVIRYRYDKPDSAIFFARKGLEISHLKNDEDGIARMLHQLGMIDDNLGKADDSRQKYLEALEIYKRLNDEKGIVRENIRLGVIEKRKGNYDKASAYFLYALKISEKIKDKAGMMEAYVTIGEVYSAQRNQIKAIEYYIKAERLSLNLPFSSIRLNMYNDLGISYREIKDYKTAIAYFNKGIEQSNTPAMMGLHISLTIGLSKVYGESGSLNEAIDLQKLALLKSRQIDNFIREYQSLVALADSYRLIDIKTGFNYLEQALSLATSRHANKQVLEVLERIATLQAGLKDYKAAYKAKEQQYKMADSFYFKDISLKIADLQAQYELNKSEVRVQELKFINSKQAMEQKVMLWITIGSIVLLCVLGINFFKIRKLNLLLNKSNTALKSSNSVKDKLFSVLAHDLRAPLASGIKLLDMINNGWLDEKEKALMLSKLADQNAASMETLNLLLRWGQMQINGVLINQVILAPFEIIKRNISLLFEAAEQKSITVRYDIEENLTVFSDADHLDFIIRNLLSNAIKFTYEGGEINISAHKESLTNEVVFLVKDNGVGISKYRIPSVFSTNSVSTNGTNNEKGTNLGLVICKEFIMANNGKIWVESIEHEGSSFFFTLKYK